MFLPIDARLETRHWDLPASSWVVPLLTYYVTLLAVVALLA